MRVANVGLDVSKASFDVCVLFEEQQLERKFQNTKRGCLACITWLESIGAARFNVVFEPTARYSDLVAEYFFNKQKFGVYQAQPKKFSDYKNSLEFRTKTDAVDAWALAVYASERAGRSGKAGIQEFKPKTAVQKKLRDVRLRLRSLYKRQGALESQLECGLFSMEIAAGIEAELQHIRGCIDAVLDYARKCIEEDEQLARDVALIDSIKGIAFKTALALVCVVDFRKFRSADDLVCFLGLSNRRRLSGTSVKGRDRISKAGDKWLRAALYWPAISAMNDNPQMRAFAERLKQRGKVNPVVRTAVARKLVTIAWALVNKQMQWDPNYPASA